jgi:phosphoenolpyruvate synthase/pyruvate phosphate dikinase
MRYVLNLLESDIAYGNHSLAILKLIQAGVPSVPNPFCLTPDVFTDYMTTDKFPQELDYELSKVYKAVTADGYKANVRTPDIACAKFPSLSYKLHNKLQIKSKNDFILAVKQRLKAIKMSVLEHDIRQIRVAILLQSTYDSHLCAIVQTDDGYGNIRIEAAFGQTTNIISREGIDADVYIIDPKKQKIKSKHIGKKEFEFVFTKSGVEKITVNEEKQEKQVFNKQQILEFMQYAQKLDSAYGPQEFECAITTKGRLLVQETRDMEKVTKDRKFGDIDVIYPSAIIGRVFNANVIEDLPDNCDEKIIIVNTLDLDFLTVLIYKYKPKGVVLKKGTLTSHASTILREAQIPSIICKDISLSNRTKIKINKNGAYEVLD